MARDGARAAAGILVGSDHIAERLREAVDEPEVNAKVRLGPPGVDTELFAAIPREDGPAAPARPGRGAGARARMPADDESSWSRDRAEAAAAVAVACRDRRAAGRLRGQADRLEGGRPTGGRVAARPRPPSGRAAHPVRLRRLPRGHREPDHRLAEGDIEGSQGDRAPRAAHSRAGRRSRSSTSRRSWPTRRRTTPRLAGRRPGRSARAAASSTRRSGDSCRLATRWSSLRPTRRLSGWSPPRLRRPESCRFRRRIRARSRSAGR